MSTPAPFSGSVALSAEDEAVYTTLREAGLTRDFALKVISDGNSGGGGSSGGGGGGDTDAQVNTLIQAALASYEPTSAINAAIAAAVAAGGGSGSAGTHTPVTSVATDGQIVLNSTAWVNVDAALVVTTPAAVGDVLMVTLDALVSEQGSTATFFDLVNAAGTRLSGLNDGYSPWRIQDNSWIQKTSGPVFHTVTAPDVVGGNVTLTLQTKQSDANSSGSLLADVPSRNTSLTVWNITGAAAAPASPVVNAQAGAYTLALGDNGNIVEMGNAAAAALTIPPHSAVPFPVGAVIEIDAVAAGKVTLTAGAGVTLQSAGGNLVLATQYEAATLRQRAQDVWVAIGGLTAS